MYLSCSKVSMSNLLSSLLLQSKPYQKQIQRGMALGHPREIRPADVNRTNCCLNPKASGWERIPGKWQLMTNHFHTSSAQTQHLFSAGECCPPAVPSPTLPTPSAMALATLFIFLSGQISTKGEPSNLYSSAKGGGGAGTQGQTLPKRDLSTKSCLFKTTRTILSPNKPT